MFRDYYEVRDWLESFIPLVYGEENLGLDRIEYLLALLGNPEKKFKSIHVAGTSGKGSTAFYIARLLQSSVLNSQFSDSSQSASRSASLQTDQQKTGKLQSENRQQKTDNWKIGLHVSPHLVDIRERMQIFSSRHPGGSETTDKRACFSQARNRISKSDSIASLQNDNSLIPMNRFIRLFNEVKPKVEEIGAKHAHLTPSYFEILVAASFKYFAEEKVDWAVVEVGLGGRLDATNVLMPEVSVITNIGLDHTEILGKTIEKIAFEKAGIIKKGVPVVTGASRGAFEVIADIAKKQQAPLITIDTQDRLLANKLLAIEAVNLALSLRGSGESRRRGNPDIRSPREFHSLAMTDVGLPGRLEQIQQGVILDGAHNPDKIKFLIHWIKNSEQLTVNGQLTLVLAFKKGKKWKKMVDLLIKEFSIYNLQFSIIATQFYAVTDTGRFAAVEPGEIAGYVKKVYRLSCIVHRNSQEAVWEALPFVYAQRKLAGGKLSSKPGLELLYKPGLSNTLVLVTGSLYLVGEVRTMWHLPEF